MMESVTGNWPRTIVALFCNAGCDKSFPWRRTTAFKISLGCKDDLAKAQKDGDWGGAVVTWSPDWCCCCSAAYFLAFLTLTASTRSFGNSSWSNIRSKSSISNSSGGGFDGKVGWGCTVQLLRLPLLRGTGVDSSDTMAAVRWSTAFCWVCCCFCVGVTQYSSVIAMDWGFRRGDSGDVGMKGGGSIVVVDASFCPEATLFDVSSFMVVMTVMVMLMMASENLWKKKNDSTINLLSTTTSALCLEFEVWEIWHGILCGFTFSL